MKKEKSALKLYLLIVLVFSAPIEIIWIINGEAAAGLAPLLMMVPLLAAIAVKLIFYRKEKLFAFGPGKAVYYLYALLIPLIYIGVSYALYWIFAPGSFAGPGAFAEILPDTAQNLSLPAVAGIVLLALLTNVPFAFGEEAGWRGFMYPVMHRMWGRNKALLIGGGIWAAWHLTPLAGGVYMAGAPLVYRAPMFVVMLLSVTVVASWLTMKSKSVWPAVLWHAAHNFFDQAIFSTMTKSGQSAWFVGETGCITTLFTVAFAVLILLFGKYDKASKPAEADANSKTDA